MPTTKEDIGKAVADALAEATRLELERGESNLYGGLTPLSIWEFEDIRDDENPGALVQPNADTLDDEQLRDDTCMLRSMYDEVLLQVDGGPKEAVVACAAMIWDEEPRKLATVLSTYDAFEGMGADGEMDVHGAMGAIALAMQSSFDFGPALGMHCRFNYADAITLAAKHLQLKYRTNLAEGEKRVLPFTLLKPVLNIPVPAYTDTAPGLIAPYMIDVLRRTGVSLLTYLFSH